MKDLTVVLMTVGFFVACVAYVALCDRIVGADEQDSEPAAANGATTVAAARTATSLSVEAEVP